MHKEILVWAALAVGCGAAAARSAEPPAAREAVAAVDGRPVQAEQLYLHRNLDGNLQKSTALLREMLARRADDPVLLWRLGRNLERMGERESGRGEKLACFADAEKSLRRSIALDARVADAHYWLGVALGRTGQTRGILKSLFLVGPIKREMRLTLDIDPRYAGAHHVLGEMLRQIPSFAGGSKKGAVRELEQAVALEPDGAVHYTALAEAYLAVGDRDRAKAALLKVFDVSNPKDPAEYDDDLQDARRMLRDLGATPPR